ncbi:uncharacterized protein MKK02DRAFT_45213 [Dioszegia hungarica]|uniref:Uncharacterized protein n=1 Tax=Dioszegia hungarica TaxID=4972 RepID=A0AA38LWD1_9TREE|nr:uncharacterized protein MKK02DRAFT_45213 [Dioszegia hungarica]KAI9636509.1 hypothetical protein MKK02DRAFT_45213 [Dioszegia hungarica]
MPSKYDSPCGIDFCSVDILESLLNARVSANAAHQALTRAFNKFEEPELRGRRGMGVKEAEMQAQYVKAADRIEKLLEKVKGKGQGCIDSGTRAILVPIVKRHALGRVPEVDSSPLSSSSLIQSPLATCPSNTMYPSTTIFGLLATFLLTSVISVPLHQDLPLAPRQDSSAFAGASAIIALFSDLSRLTSATASASATDAAPSSSTGLAPGTNGSGISAFYSACEGTNVSRVMISPCEGGSGAQGSACVFTVGKNYTITLTYTSPSDIVNPRVGLASYNGEVKTAYSGQSFGGCSYTPCPVSANVESEYTYPFRTLRAPSFDRLVFNATDGVTGPSFMCASVPVTCASG